MSSKKTEGLDLMRQPFPPHQISQLCRSTKKDNQKGRCNKCRGYHGLPAIQLAYVGHAALTDRLLDADPNWTWEPLAIGSDGYPVIDRDGGMWIRLTVCGVTRLGYGDAQGKTGGDAMKERIGDALRNAAMRFGAALDLWHKGDLHQDDAEDPASTADEAKRSQADEIKKSIAKAINRDELNALYGDAQMYISPKHDAALWQELKDEFGKRGNELKQAAEKEKAA